MAHVLLSDEELLKLFIAIVKEQYTPSPIITTKTELSIGIVHIIDMGNIYVASGILNGRRYVEINQKLDEGMSARWRYSILSNETSPYYHDITPLDLFSLIKKIMESIKSK